MKALESWVTQRHWDERVEGLAIVAFYGILLLPASFVAGAFLLQMLPMAQMLESPALALAILGLAFLISVPVYARLYRSSTGDHGDLTLSEPDRFMAHPLGSILLWPALLFWRAADGIHEIRRASGMVNAKARVIAAVLQEPKPISTDSLFLECTRAELEEVLPWLLRQKEFFALRDPARIGLTESGREAFGQFINTRAGK